MGPNPENLLFAAMLNGGQGEKMLRALESLESDARFPPSTVL